MWSTKERDTYDKMVTKQADPRYRTCLRKNPNQVACPHHLSFSFSQDDFVPLKAAHILP
jgi:hypothetical protein